MLKTRVSRFDGVVVVIAMRRRPAMFVAISSGVGFPRWAVRSGARIVLLVGMEQVAVFSANDMLFEKLVAEGTDVAKEAQHTKQQRYEAQRAVFAGLETHDLYLPSVLGRGNAVK